MTREEAIEYAEKKKLKLEEEIERTGSYYGAYAMYSTEFEFVSMAISALRQQDVADKDVGKMTNAQKIRAMTDEELAEFIKHIKVRAALCKAVKNNDAFEELCSAEWLQQPAEEDDHA